MDFCTLTQSITFRIEITNKCISTNHVFNGKYNGRWNGKLNLNRKYCDIIL